MLKLNLPSTLMRRLCRLLRLRLCLLRVLIMLLLLLLLLLAPRQDHACHLCCCQVRKVPGAQSGWQVLLLPEVELELARAVLLDHLQHALAVSSCHLCSWGCSSHLQLAQVQ
jgi:hypothetical protein